MVEADPARVLIDGAGRDGPGPGRPRPRERGADERSAADDRQLALADGARRADAGAGEAVALGYRGGGAAGRGWTILSAYSALTIVHPPPVTQPGGRARVRRPS